MRRSLVKCEYLMIEDICLSLIILVSRLFSCGVKLWSVKYLIIGNILTIHWKKSCSNVYVRARTSTSTASKSM